MIPFRRRETANDREIFHLRGDTRQVLDRLRGGVVQVRAAVE